MKTKVAFEHCSDLNGASAVFTEKVQKSLIKHIDAIFAHFPDIIKAIYGAKILLKPNLVRPQPIAIPAMTTDIRVLLALVDYLKDTGAKQISIGEKPGFGFPARKAFNLTGLDEYAKKSDFDLICFDEEPWIRQKNPKADLFMKPLIPKAALEAELLINVPKMKTHMHTLVSLGMKNFQGLVNDNERMLFHRGDINHKIVDTVLACPPDFTIIDALLPMEGQAPFFGDAVPDFNILIGGTNVAATDAVACMVMKISPEEVTYLRIAREKGLGPIEPALISIQGDDLKTAARAFKRPIISSAGVYKNIKVIEGGVCLGCMSSVRHSLDKLDFDGLIDKIGKVTICSGRPMPNHQFIGNWEGELWLFGNCTAEITFPELEKRMKPHFIQGCPPHVLDLYNAIKDNEK